MPYVKPNHPGKRPKPMGVLCPKCKDMSFPYHITATGVRRVGAGGKEVTQVCCSQCGNTFWTSDTNMRLQSRYKDAS